MMDGKIFKKILIFVTVTSLILCVFFGSDITLENITNLSFSYSHFKNIMFSISASVFSSTILLWGFDFINRQKQEKEEQHRREIFYNKITSILNKYYDFYLKLFIATRTEPISKDHKVLNSLFACKDEFEKQLLNIEPFYKKGYMMKPDSMEKSAVLRRTRASDGAWKQFFEENTLLWYESWAREAKDCNDLLSTIIDNFSYFLPVNLLDDLIVLNEKINIHSGIKRCIEFPITAGSSDSIGILPIDFILSSEKFFETLELLEKCISFIEDETKRDIRLRDTKFFNEGNVSPTLGHNCKSKESTENQEEK